MAEVFKPTKTIAPTMPGFEYSGAVLSAREQMNREDSDQLTQLLRDRVQNVGKQAIAYLSGPLPERRSSREGVIFYDSFGMGVDNARLTRPEYLRRVLNEAEIYDHDGLSLPFVWIAAAGLHSNYELSSIEKVMVADGGDFSPMANTGLLVAERFKWERVHLFGPSMGGNTALAGASSIFAKNFDVGTVIDCDPTNTEARQPSQLRKDFMADSDLKPAREASGVDAQLANIKFVRGNLQFFYSTLMSINRNVMIKGMTHDHFKVDADQALSVGQVDRILVAYSDNGHIVNPKIIEPQLSELHQADTAGRLMSVCIEGVDHTWMDNYPLLGEVALLGFGK